MLLITLNYFRTVTFCGFFSVAEVAALLHLICYLRKQHDVIVATTNHYIK